MPDSDEQRTGRRNEAPSPETPGDRRVAKQAQMRARLLAGARAVFARVGVSEATIAQIAAEAGVGFGTFYLYFQTKEDAYQAVLLEGFAMLNEQLDAIIVLGRRNQRSWAEMFSEAVHVYVRFAAEHRDLYLAMFAGQQGGPHLDSEVARRSLGRIAALAHYAWQNTTGQTPTRLLDEGPLGYPLSLLTVNIAAVLNRTAIWWLRNTADVADANDPSDEGGAQTPTLEAVSALTSQFLIGALTHSLPADKGAYTK